jgi:alpha-tubulin suppressor-like RCC1 family protein
VLGRELVRSDTGRAVNVPGDTLTTDPGVADTVGAVTCGVATSGAVFCWGAGRRGQLGNGVGTSSLTAVPVTGGGFSDVSVGGSHVCALRGGEAFCWGAYDLGYQPRVDIGTAPTSVAPPGSFATITSGIRHTCAVAPNGDGSCWGSNEFGPFGDGLQALIRRSPVRVLTPQ